MQIGNEHFESPGMHHDGLELRHAGGCDGSIVKVTGASSEPGHGSIKTWTVVDGQLIPLTVWDGQQGVGRDQDVSKTWTVS